MHSVPSALTALHSVIARHTNRSPAPCRLFQSASQSSDERPVRPATRGIERFDPEVYPPFETLTLGPPEPGERPHSVVLLNDGPGRYVELSVRGAGLGQLYDGRQFLDAGGVLRLALGRPDEYELAIAAPRGRTYGVEIEPSRFECGARVTDVVVRSDGYVRYQPL